MHEHTRSDELSPLFRLCATRQYIPEPERVACFMYLSVPMPGGTITCRKETAVPPPPSRAEMLPPRK